MRRPNSVQGKRGDAVVIVVVIAIASVVPAVVTVLISTPVSLSGPLWKPQCL